MPQRTLLIVDDEKSILIALQMILGGDYTTFTAQTGSEALELLRDTKPDVIILDVGLPDVSGIELITRIKSLAPETLIIMVSANDEFKTSAAAIELGADDYLFKPLGARALKTAIQNLFEKRKSNPATLNNPSF